MMTRQQANAGLVAAAILARASGAGAEGARTKELPPPRGSGGKPLIDALKLRRSIREYADRSLSKGDIHRRSRPSRIAIQIAGSPEN
jgi:hypothetical protein